MEIGSYAQVERMALEKKPVTHIHCHSKAEHVDTDVATCVDLMMKFQKALFS